MDVEDTIFEEAMAVNSIAAANRLIELLRENDTNSILSAKGDVRIKRLLWFLNSQCYGQLEHIDMAEEWETLNKQFRESKGKAA